MSPIFTPFRVPLLNDPAEVSMNNPFSVSVPAVSVMLPVLILRPLALMALPAKLAVAFAIVKLAAFQFSVPAAVVVSMAPGESKLMPL